MSKNYVVDYETAETSFNDFCDYHELENDMSEMGEEEKESFSKLKSDIIKAIRKGLLVINDDFNVEYTVSKWSEKAKGETLTIKRPKGKAYMRMDEQKTGHDMKKVFSMLSGVIDKDVSYFGQLDVKDIEPLRAVVTLFLA